MNFILAIYGQYVEYSIHIDYDLCYRVPLTNHHEFILNNSPHLFKNVKLIGRYLNFCVPDHIKEYCYSVIKSNRFLPYVKSKKKIFIDGCNPNPYGVPHLGNIASSHYGFIYSNLLKCKYSNVQYAFYVNDLGARKLGNVDNWIEYYISNPNNHTPPDIFVFQSQVVKNYGRFLKGQGIAKESSSSYIERKNKHSNFLKRYLFKDGKITYFGSDVALMMYLSGREYDNYILVTGKDHKGYLDEFKELSHPLIKLTNKGIYSPIILSNGQKYSKTKKHHPITLENFHIYFQDIYLFNLTCLSMYGEKDRSDKEFQERYKSLQSRPVNSFKSFFSFISAFGAAIESESLIPITKYINNPLMKRHFWVDFLIKKYIC